MVVLTEVNCNGLITSTLFTYTWIILILFRHTPGRHGISAHFPDRAAGCAPLGAGEPITVQYKYELRIDLAREVRLEYAPRQLFR
jgi:hypothetical protein